MCVARVQSFVDGSLLGCLLHPGATTLMRAVLNKVITVLWTKRGAVDHGETIKIGDVRC